MTRPTSDELEAMAVRLEAGKVAFMEDAAAMLRACKTDSAMTAPDRIWMSNPDDEGEVSVWFDPDEGGNEYVSVERVKALEAENARLKARVDAAEAALEAESDWALVQPNAHATLRAERAALKAESARLREALADMRDDKIAYRHASHFRRRAAVVLAALQENDT
jgi:hypothetical protein